MKWNQGSERIEQLLADGRLQQVPASRDHADFLVGQARRHAAAAAAIATIDPAGAYQLSYDAARKALTAVLENQGLRPTQSGGHVVVYDAVRAQLVPPFGSTIAPFNRMRRARNESEYPSRNRPALTAGDVEDNLPRVQALIELAERFLGQMDAFL